MASPLYLHPSDGSNSVVVEKLQGASNFRSWKRSLEISLASKRKIGFVTGAIKIHSTDVVKQEAWDTRNNMVISWIVNNVTEPIKRSVMFVESAHEIWKMLEQRFMVSNRSRSHRINKQIYETKQESRSITDHYTEMKVMWEELDSLNHLPPISTLTEEINAFINSLNRQQEELKLFQFLNGLKEIYGLQRSNLLMMAVFPSVEVACSILQQEESQREILKPVKEEPKSDAMYNKGNEGSCGVCGKVGHLREKCWFVIGFHERNARNGKDYNGKKKEFGGNRGKKWSKGGRNGKGGFKVVANASVVNSQAHLA